MLAVLIKFNTNSVMWYFHKDIFLSHKNDSLLMCKIFSKFSWKSNMIHFECEWRKVQLERPFAWFYKMWFWISLILILTNPNVHINLSYWGIIFGSLSNIKSESGLVKFERDVLVLKVISDHLVVRSAKIFDVSTVWVADD